MKLLKLINLTKEYKNNTDIDRYGVFDIDLEINNYGFYSLVGPSAFAYSNDQVAAVKILSDFAKDHPALVLKVGIVDGELADQAKLAEYATLPSREGLLTMLAGGMIGLVKDLSICLDLYSQQKEEEEN